LIAGWAPFCAPVQENGFVLLAGGIKRLIRIAFKPLDIIVALGLQIGADNNQAEEVEKWIAHIRRLGTGGLWTLSRLEF